MNTADFKFEALSQLISDWKKTNEVRLGPVTGPMVCEFVKDEKVLERLEPVDQINILNVAYQFEEEGEEKLGFARQLLGVLQKHKTQLTPQDTLNIAFNFANEINELGSVAEQAASSIGREATTFSFMSLFKPDEEMEAAAILHFAVEEHLIDFSKGVGKVETALLGVAADAVTNTRPGTLTNEERFRGASALLDRNRSLEPMPRDVVAGIVLDGLRNPEAYGEAVKSHPISDQLATAFAVAVTKSFGNARQTEAMQVGDNLIVKAAGDDYRDAKAYIDITQALGEQFDSQALAQHLAAERAQLRPMNIMWRALGTVMPNTISQQLHMNEAPDSIAAKIHRSNVEHHTVLRSLGNVVRDSVVEGIERLTGNNSRAFITSADIGPE